MMKELIEKIARLRGFRWWRCPVFKVWIPADISKEEEIKLLEEAREYFKSQLEIVEKRLQELKK
jgi:hypothetical protein